MNDSDTQNRRIKIACPTCSQKIDVTGCEPFSKLNCPVCNQVLIIPKWFQTFLLEEPEGEGGMAIVYRALDIALDREVAIKVLNCDKITGGISPDLFLQEARVAATINHTAVVPIYSCGQDDGSPYIVMQYMSGGNLEKRLAQANGRLPIPQVIRWFHDIAEGLLYALEHNVVHHDIKPANIMLDIDNNAKITDFGLAQVLFDRQNTGTASDRMQNWLSPHYVSPEKILTGTESFEGDIYSLGATFYHLLTGKTPFRNNDTEELLRMRLMNDPVSPALLRPEIGDTLSQLILQMMSREPAKRPRYSVIVHTLDMLLQMFRDDTPKRASSGRIPKENPELPKKHKIMHVDEARLKMKRRIRTGHVGSLLFLLLVVCIASVLLLVPKYADLRKLYNYCPFMDTVYGPLPLEKVSFVPEDPQYPSFSVCVENAENILTGNSEKTSPQECVKAAWLCAVNAFLNDSSGAVQLARDLLEQQEISANSTDADIRADLFCLDVIANKKNTPPDHCYLSEEQQARFAIGKFLRSLYDTDPQSFSKRTITAHFNALEDALWLLKPLSDDEPASWTFKLFYPDINSWRKIIEGKVSPDAQPIFNHISTLNNKSSDF